METHQLGDLLIGIYKNLKSTVERDLRPYGIGMGQLQILMIFFKDVQQSLAQNEIVNALGVDKGNISRSVMKLLENNYLEPDPSFNRSYRLSEKGLMLKEEIIRIFMETNERMTKEIDKRDLGLTVVTMGKILENLERTL